MEGFTVAVIVVIVCATLVVLAAVFIGGREDRRRDDESKKRIYPNHRWSEVNPNQRLQHPSPSAKAMNDDDEIELAKVRLYVALISVPPAEITCLEAELMVILSKDPVIQNRIRIKVA